MEKVGYMVLKKWEDIPENLKNEQVKIYYDKLEKKKLSLLYKRIFDVMLSSFLLILFVPLFLIIAILIKRDSKGSILFKQTRVTQYGRTFTILKFRTMVQQIDKLGTQVTVKQDVRITKIGHLLRKYRLDELTQLINILCGDMSFVGTRPEVPKYVRHYTDKMKATLLLPAGVTSKASILYKDEEKLLMNAKNADKIYIEQVLPEKMEYNLDEIEKFSITREIGTMLYTIIALFTK